MPELVWGTDREAVSCRHLRKYYKCTYKADQLLPISSGIQHIQKGLWLNTGTVSPRFFFGCHEWTRIVFEDWNFPHRDAKCPLMAQKPDVFYNSNVCCYRSSHILELLLQVNKGWNLNFFNVHRNETILV